MIRQPSITDLHLRDDCARQDRRVSYAYLPHVGRAIINRAGDEGHRDEAYADLTAELYPSFFQYDCQTN